MADGQDDSLVYINFFNYVGFTFLFRISIQRSLEFVCIIKSKTIFY